MFEKLSEELRAARDNAQLTPEQLAKIIKIDIKFLLKIEQGDLSFLPELYIKAFLRDYARAVHLDDKLIMKKYQAARDGKAFEPVEPEQQTEDDPAKNLPTEIDYTPSTYKVVKTITEPVRALKNPSRKFSDRQIQLMLFGVVALIITILIVVFAFRATSVPNIENDTAITEQAAKGYEEPASQPAQAPAQVDSMFSVTLQTDAPCWIKYTVDNGKEIDTLLKTNVTLANKAKTQIKLNVGNSSAVDIFINGKPQDFPKQRNKRALLVVTKDGVKPVKE
jgi:cytoskeletal protein RodZ